MGQLSAGGINNDLLNRNVCVICQKPGMRPHAGNVARQCFEYVCAVCNPNTVISISDHVLMSDFLDLLKENPEARKNLKAEVTSYTGKEFTLGFGLLEYFLGMTKNKPITYNDWKRGDITGHIKAHGEISQEDLTRINGEQKQIFDKKVGDKLSHLKRAFELRKNNSVNPKMMIEQEVETIKNIIIKGRHVLDYKPIENDAISLGAYNFMWYNLKAIRDMYELAVNGSLDYSILPSENQKVGIAALNSKVHCMVEAIAFDKFLAFLEAQMLASDEQKQSTNNDRFTETAIRDLENKIDRLMEIIVNGQSDNEDDRRDQFYQLQAGQEIIFNELQDLRDLLPNMSKKSWGQLLWAKLLEMIATKALSEDTAKWIWRELTKGEDLTDNLLNL